MTAEELLKLKGYALPKHILVSGNDVVKLMIEFAKYHVKLAIKECIEEAPSGSSTDPVYYEDVENVLKDCYPLSNIK
jgi:hypothetical protein